MRGCRIFNAWKHLQKLCNGFTPFASRACDCHFRTNDMGHLESADTFTIAAAHLFDGTAMRGPASVRISEGRIESITFGEEDGEARASTHLAEDVVLAPGFIDIQVNGGGGVLLNDQPTEAGVRRILEAHR